MSNRAEGLSPCYYSLASPDIPASYVFRWTSPGTQTSATIRIYSSTKALLHTYTHSSSTQSVDMSLVGYSFTDETIYYWTVTPQNGTTVYEDSVMAKFIYASAPQEPRIAWSTTSPKRNDIVSKSTRFEEVKSNLLTLLSNYSVVSNAIMDKANGLFTGNVIPSRNDFRDLQDVIEYLGEKEGIQYPSDDENLHVSTWVGDGLGISDLDKVVNYINYLTTIPPKEVQDIGFTVPESTMYSMTSVTASSDGKEDSTIDVSWDSGGVTSVNALINFTSLSPSKDVWFYESTFSYGPNGKYKSLLFFRPTDLSTETSRSFDANWHRLYTKDNIGSARLEFEMFTVDHYGNMSTKRTAVKTWSSNFKVPLGVSHYVLEAQRSSLSETSGPYTSRPWYQKYSGSNKNSGYTITSANGNLWNRVKVVDKSGLESDWMYATGYISFDPLKAPGKPGNFRVTGSTTSSLSFAWNAVSTAESYELRTEKEGTIVYEGTKLSTTATGLNDNTSYDFYVRAKNRAGNSDWVEVIGKTKNAEVTKVWTSTGSKSWRNNWGWRNDNSRVYQGEWCEIAGSPNQTAPAGTCWGKHRGFWYFNYSDIQNNLSGKEIVSIRVWIKRANTYHGHYDDQTVHMWMHNLNSSDRPSTPSVGHHYEVPDPQFSKGEETWINLPKSYGERLRDGTMKGLALYVPDWGRMPYMYFSGTAKIEITYK